MEVLNVAKQTKRQETIQLRTLDSLDGRTRAAARAKALVADIEEEFGNELTVVQRQLAISSALVTAMVEDMSVRWLEGGKIDFLVFAQLVSVQKRVLGAL